MNYKKSIFMSLALISGYANCSQLKAYVLKRIPNVTTTNDSFGKMMTRIASPEATLIGLEGSRTLGNYIIEMYPVELAAVQETAREKLGQDAIPTGCCRLEIKSKFSNYGNDAQPSSPRSQDLLRIINAWSLEKGDIILAIAFIKNGAQGFDFLGASKHTPTVSNAAAAQSSNQSAS